MRTNELLDNHFLCLFLNSAFAKRYFEENKVETARANIRLKDINDMPINLPSLEEQMEISRIVVNLFNQEIKLKENAIQTVNCICSMKKSILAKAFRGELGTNDPAEPPVKF